MSIILWSIAAIVAALVGLTLLTWLPRPRVPPLEPGTELPDTPLQRLARWSLVLGVVPALAAGGMVVRYGSQAIYEDDGLRAVFTLCLLVIVVIFLVTTVRLKSWVARMDATLDERDRAILDRAPALQPAAMLLILAAWMIGLVERFHGVGAVPLFYLYLVFWSCWVAMLLALPLGILIGYRRR